MIVLGGSFWPRDSLITHILFELCLFRNLAQCTLFLLTLYFFHSNSHVIGNESIPFWSLKFVTPGHNSLSEKLSRFEPFHSFHQLPLRPRICINYFLSFPQKNRQQRKLRQTKCLLFNSLVIRFTLISKKPCILTLEVSVHWCVHLE